MFNQISNQQNFLQNLRLGSTGEISVNDGTNFGTFENVGVGTTNVGFLKIGNEIIEYTNVTGNVIGGTITRGNNQANYPIGTPVFKYETWWS